MFSKVTQLNILADKISKFHRRFETIFKRTPDQDDLSSPQTLSELHQLLSDRRKASGYSLSKALVDKLWTGYSHSALSEMHLKAEGRGRRALSMSKSIWALAEWYGVHGNPERALALCAPHLRQKYLPKVPRKRLFLAAFCAVEAGDFAAARTYCESIRKRYPDDPNLPLALANAHAAETGPRIDPSCDQTRLDLLNSCFKTGDIASLHKKDVDAPLSITNLSSDVVAASEGLSGPKVSIIVPVYNGAKTLGNTLESLLGQSWAKIEIIVVDDCSTDETAEVIKAYQARDARIIALQTQENSGSYTARNLALGHANGDLVTVHDANDWSHPQKIARQAQHLAENPNLIANHTHRARVNKHLIFQGKFRQKYSLMDWDPSSFMIRRDAALSMGGWDLVRISADAEFIARAQKVFGDRIESLPRRLGVLSFAYDEKGSLTSSGPTHGRTINHGVRREYGEASRYWHSKQPTASLNIEPQTAKRPFPVPGLILPRRVTNSACELLLVADFNAGHPLVDKVMNTLSANPPARTGHVALFQWRYFALDTTAPLAAPVRDLVHRQKVSHLIPGETMKANRVLVLTPDALTHPMDNLPQLQCGTVEAVFDKIPIEETEHPLHATLPEIEKQMLSAFRSIGHWAATSPAVCSGLEEQLNGTRRITLRTPDSLL